MTKEEEKRIIFSVAKSIEQRIIAAFKIKSPMYFIDEYGMGVGVMIKEITVTSFPYFHVFGSIDINRVLAWMINTSEYKFKTVDIECICELLRNKQFVITKRLCDLYTVTDNNVRFKRL